MTMFVHFSMFCPSH